MIKELELHFGDVRLISSDTKDIILRCSKTGAKYYRAQLKFIRLCEEAYTLLDDADAFNST